MSAGPDYIPAPNGGFVHHLLRARDWQDRPEFGELCQWWKDGGVGVCALVGIGGAGKTAIVERFLQVLPDGYPEHPKVSKDASLAAPARLLVFSFYDAPNPETFFTDLAAWLEGHLHASRAAAGTNQATHGPSYHQTLDLLALAGKCLLVLDGLEKVQDDGSRGGTFGQILDGRLRDLVLRVADGWLPHIPLVITSRFRLYEPLKKRTWYYQQIEIERLQPRAAVQLLRDRGVHGTDDQLEHVAREQGFHALSVDLIGGYIARFWRGDSQSFCSLLPEGVESVGTTNSELDPRIAALREQESKFARLAERYHQALAHSDPVALALLQRVCLFRLGVEAKTLVSIFTGRGKESISGPGLAPLNEQQLQSKLQLLMEMRLIEASNSPGSNSKAHIYTVHPAVRDGFLKRLDVDTARQGHDAASEELNASLGGLPDANASDTATLDLMEEIVYHTLAAGHIKSAWDIYYYRIGGYQNLGWRLGAYERGERICRAFAFGHSPQNAPLPLGLSVEAQAKFINVWGLYLKNLGQLDAAAHCYKRHNELRLQRRELEYASMGNQNLAQVLLLAGRLPEGLRAAEKAMLLAERAGANEELEDSLAFLGYASTQIGDIDSALEFFMRGPQWKTADVGTKTPVLRGAAGIVQCVLWIRLARLSEAERLTRTNNELCSRRYGPDHLWSAGCNLLLADIAREKNDLTAARGFLHQAREWALQRDAKEPLCWSALVLANIELSAFRSLPLVRQDDSQNRLAHMAVILEDGLRIARECGYGTYHIDLLLMRAQLALYKGCAADSEKDVLVALEEGIHPPSESGFPELLAASDPESLYVWGLVQGRQLLGEALLLQAAQKLGQTEFISKGINRLPAEVLELLGRAREQLAEALELWRKLRDPRSNADINPLGERTRRVIELLDSGVLTEYPLEPMGKGKPAELPNASEADKANKRSRTAPKKHVFLSYCRDNKPDVARLYDELIAAGEAIWWDQDILPGQDWKFEIRKAMKSAYAVVLCLSQESAARTTSGIYPEALDAIAAYREYSPGEIFLIPARLSDCEIPPIEIDGTRTLDRIQFVDLFPRSQRAEGFGRLVRSLQAAPHHP